MARREACDTSTSWPAAPSPAEIQGEAEQLMVTADRKAATVAVIRAQTDAFPQGIPYRLLLARGQGRRR